jgi:small conductance mechanosensitive channel
VSPVVVFSALAPVADERARDAHRFVIAPPRLPRSAPMPPIPLADETFWDKNGDWISAGISLIVAFAFAFAVDRFVIQRATRVASRVGGDVSVSRAAKTRLRVIRRLVFVTIVVIGVAVALSQFTKLNKLATTILASSAVVGLVLGLAARQVLANPLAGILLAISQPIRIGDMVTIADETGRVDDLTLSYTFIDTGDGRLVIVPNEQVIGNVVVNRSTGDSSAPAMASVWVPPGADLARAREALEALEPSQVDIAEITPEGVRIEVHGPRRTGGTGVSGEESALRERAQRALREAGLFRDTGTLS